MTDITKQLAVINIVGLSSSLISKENTPFLAELSQQQSIKALKPTFPAVTTTGQSAMLTGKTATDHGIVGNGWYFHDLAEVGFWKQSNHLVKAEKIWDKLKKGNAEFTVANSFWWYNMYSSVDYSMTPRPHYPADGSKIFDLYSAPDQFHYQVEQEIGKFPFFHFWGPKADIKSSEWIAKAAIKVQEKYQPNLHLVYLPHLDYNLQKLGPNHPDIANDLGAIDNLARKLFEDFQKLNTECVFVSEYGIEPVNQHISINKVLRENNYIKVRKTGEHELLDAGASAAFAVADHQIAHIYVNDKSRLAKVKALIENIPGVEKVLDDNTKAHYGIDNSRAGDLVAIANADAWFTYYYWLDDKNAPDFARTIDIHRKPGYDPVEMFLDPDSPFVKGRLIWRVLQKKLGFRTLLDVIPLKPELINGSHGRVPDESKYWPVVIGDASRIESCETLTDIFTLIEGYFE